MSADSRLTEPMFLAAPRGRRGRLTAIGLVVSPEPAEAFAAVVRAQTIPRR